jgi:UrcA family protein
MSKISLALTSCIALVVSFGALDPARANAPASVVVKFDDLDLNRDSDVQILLRRLDGAARRVCRMERDQVYSILSCRRDAVARGVADVGSPRLYAAWSERREKPRLFASLW